MESKLYIKYKEIDELLNRKEFILKELQNRLDETGNEDYIKNVETTVGENSYSLVITLSKL